MATRNPVSVLPVPVGEATRTSPPAMMRGHAARCGSVGPPGNRRRNQLATAGWRRRRMESAGSPSNASTGRSTAPVGSRCSGAPRRPAGRERDAARSFGQVPVRGTTVRVGGATTAVQSRGVTGGGGCRGGRRSDQGPEGPAGAGGRLVSGGAVHRPSAATMPSAAAPTMAATAPRRAANNQPAASASTPTCHRWDSEAARGTAEPAMAPMTAGAGPGEEGLDPVVGPDAGRSAARRR